MPSIDWGVVNTGLILAAIGYLYRQARIVDQVRQALLGMEGQGGVFAEVKLLRERTHDLANKMATLTATVEHLTHALQEKQ